MLETLHLLWTPSNARPWWPTDERLDDAPATVIADCCLCKMPSADTVCRVVTSWEPPLGGLGCYQEPPPPWEKRKRGRPRKQVRWAKPYIPTGGYYDDRVEIECAPWAGCKANPRRLRGKHLRERY